MSGENHCRDCCCARSWKALEISTDTGKSIPKHIGELRSLLLEFMTMRGRAGFRLDEWESRAQVALAPSAPRTQPPQQAPRELLDVLSEAIERSSSDAKR